MIAVTGAGLLTPLGDDVRRVMDALHSGTRAPARIADFDASRYTAVRGMRVYNRTTQLGICAAKLALDGAKLDTANGGGDDVGFIMASTFGHFDTLVEYDRSLVVNGLARTNPALMPLAISSAPGGATALAFTAKAFSITLSDGAASALDAIGLAMRLLTGRRARACVVVASFTTCKELAISAERAGLLARSGAAAVLDRRATGTVFGEAAAALVLERHDDALARGAPVLGFVRGQASSFASGAVHVGAAMARACTGALAAAGIAAVDVGLVSSGANGEPEADRAEAEALLAVLGRAGPAAVTAVKSSFGDAGDASGLVQTIVALASLRAKSAPPIVGFADAAVPGLRYASGPLVLEERARAALVTATSRTGACAALAVTEAPT